MYDLQEIRESLTDNDIFDLLLEWGGNPQYTNFGVLSDTIDHNPAGSGSRKLYYYGNSHMFVSWTGSDDPFDIFELCRKVYSIQKHQEISLPAAIRIIAFHFGLSGTSSDEAQEELPDWELLKKYDHIEEIKPQTKSVTLKSYNQNILKVFNYNTKIIPWIKDHITEEAMKEAHIGYFPATDQIVIPHYDINSRLIGIRGRTLAQEDAELYGKYRPLIINNKMYNHPLGMNLYNLNNAKDNIAATGRAIIVEGEKSALQASSYFGAENNITVACCGSNISNYQMQLVLSCGAKEVIIALDRQFQEIGDEEFKKLTKNLTNIHKKYSPYVRISFIFDKHMITKYKDSPYDEGKDIFMKLYNERIYL